MESDYQLVRTPIAHRCIWLLLYIFLSINVFRTVTQTENTFLSAILFVGLGLFIFGALLELSYLFRGNPAVLVSNSSSLIVTSYFRQVKFDIQTVQLMEQRPGPFIFLLTVKDATQTLTITDVGVKPIWEEQLNNFKQANS